MTPRSCCCGRVARHAAHAGRRAAARRGRRRPACSACAAIGRSRSRRCAPKLAGRKIAVVFDKAMSYGYEGPICGDLKAALCGVDDAPVVYGDGERARRPRHHAGRSSRRPCDRAIADQDDGVADQADRLAQPAAGRRCAVTRIIDLPDDDYVLPGKPRVRGLRHRHRPAADHCGARRQDGAREPSELPHGARRHVPDRRRSRCRGSTSRSRRPRRRRAASPPGCAPRGVPTR